MTTTATLTRINRAELEAAAAAEVPQQPMQKVKTLDDLPEPFRTSMLSMPHSRAWSDCPEADRYEVTYRAGDTVAYDRRTTSGSNRETYLVTGLAVIDRDRYVVRVTVNDSSRTRFIPVVGHEWTDQTTGEVHWSGQWFDASTDGTKRAAFEYHETSIHGPAVAASLAEIEHPQTVDERDAAYLAQSVASVARTPGPRVGDYVAMPDGTMRRFTYDHDERGLQTTLPAVGGSFHLTPLGASYSGGLDSCIRREHLTQTPETRPGLCWIWHHQMSGANRGVDVRAPWRVFRYLPPAE